MILDKLNIIGIMLPELKAETPWTVYGYCPLSMPIA
jgi:hypothetical protein